LNRPTLIVRGRCFCSSRSAITFQAVRFISELLWGNSTYQRDVLIDVVKCTNAYYGLTSYPV